jgi:16S rRNA (guanine1207-N2)-methyltransferase
LKSSLSTKRLIQAQKKGFFKNLIPEILVLGCSELEALKFIGFNNLIICHPEKSVIRKAEEFGFRTIMSDNDLIKKKFKSIQTSFVWITKSRRETFFNIAIAFIITKKGGKVIVTGEKKDGVEHFINKIKSLIDPIAILSKSHGKIGLFSPPNQLPQTFMKWKREGKFKKITSEYLTSAGTFSEKSIDKGSELLANQFSNKLFGNVVDIGAGWGYLSSMALKNNSRINLITLIDSNLGAIKSARMNIKNSKAKFLWLDLENDEVKIKNYDHVIMNPPFHIGRKVDFNLGLTFLSIAKTVLVKGGTLWMVFNRGLPYEKIIINLFPNYEFINETKKYKVIRAKKN